MLTKLLHTLQQVMIYRLAAGKWVSQISMSKKIVHFQEISKQNA